ncbi:hypothetical protein RSOLAG22IIIB_12759 [Rhizoctonia solani]|uniref:Tyrosinase copper-binding domain-containing protein n=1 Tax=Rhizoctonia solani TaxID=456999 RepID=A0A0K6GGT0_9AGAM|nr:hypothetical protein RSOLAG22IIIB_12759 [Rhizoctonia solani]
MKLTTALGLSTLVAFVAAAEPQTCSSLEVRREWRTFSKAERKGWIDAVNCLNKKPRTGKLQLPVDTQSYPESFHIAPLNESSTYYDDLVYAHMNLNPLIHWTGLFLPWHRVYLHEWTNILRKECGLGPHKLRRRYIQFPFGGSSVSAESTFTPAEIEVVLSKTNFTSFHGYLEQLSGMHSAIHLIMGGDMGTVCPAGTSGTIYCPRERSPTFSANEPMFHLHHGNIDRLWWLWQEKSTDNKNAFHGGSVQNTSSLDIFPNGQAPWLNKSSIVPSAGLWPTYNIGETLDTRSWPWCYVYE